MIRHRTVADVKRYDFFKLLVGLSLLVLLIFHLYRNFEWTQADSGAQTGTIADTGLVAEPAVEEEPTTTNLIVPMLNLSGGELTIGTVALSGKSEPNTTVEIVANDSPLGQTSVSQTGVWSFTGTIDEPGNYEIVVNGLDSAGNLYASSEPALLSLVAPAADLARPTLKMPAGSLTTGELSVSGSAEPGGKVEVMADGEVIGTATVGSDGTWSFTGIANETGDHEIVVNGLDAGGNIYASSGPVTLTLVAPDVEFATPSLISPQVRDALTAGRLLFRGSGQPATEVEIVVDGEVLGTATVRQTGFWSFTGVVEEPGEHEVVINGLDVDGNIVASSTATTLLLEAAGADQAQTGITSVDDEPPDETEASAPAESESSADLVCQEEYVVIADDWLSKLADKYFNDLFLYPAIVTATNEKNQEDSSFVVIENPDLIEPGWKLCIVDADTASALVDTEN